MCLRQTEGSVEVFSLRKPQACLGQVLNDGEQLCRLQSAVAVLAAWQVTFVQGLGLVSLSLSSCVKNSSHDSSNSGLESSSMRDSERHRYH